jgi:hypothetical protein
VKPENDATATTCWPFLLGAIVDRVGPKADQRAKTLRGLGAYPEPSKRRRCVDPKPVRPSVDRSAFAGYGSHPR